MTKAVDGSGRYFLCSCNWDLLICHMDLLRMTSDQSCFQGDTYDGYQTCLIKDSPIGESNKINCASCYCSTDNEWSAQLNLYKISHFSCLRIHSWTVVIMLAHYPLLKKCHLNSVHRIYLYLPIMCVPLAISEYISIVRPVELLSKPRDRLPEAIWSVRYLWWEFIVLVFHLVVQIHFRKNYCSLDCLDSKHFNPLIAGKTGISVGLSIIF